MICSFVLFYLDGRRVQGEVPETVGASSRQEGRECTNGRVGWVGFRGLSRSLQLLDSPVIEALLWPAPPNRPTPPIDYVKHMRRSLREKLGDDGFGRVPAARTKTMRAVKATRNRSTEMAFRMALVRGGFRGWSNHPKDVQGRPDFFFHAERLALFIDGCFWHGCPHCRGGHIPRTNNQYWVAKIHGNKDRDRKVNRVLRSGGVKVIRFWEHELKDNMTRCLKRLSATLLPIG
jgi:DNA mismatch endonuclease (patch repair protein)